MSDEVQSAKAAFDASLDRQDEMLRQRTLAEMSSWEEKGWRYMPVAYEARDLPQADIPAFPGTEGGGARTAGGRGGKVRVAAADGLEAATGYLHRKVGEPGVALGLYSCEPPCGIARSARYLLVLH